MLTANKLAPTFGFWEHKTQKIRITNAPHVQNTKLKQNIIIIHFFLDTEIMWMDF